MKRFKEGTLGKRPIGDPILANLVDEALSAPRKLLVEGRMSGSFPLDSAMDEVLGVAERITALSPKSKGEDRDARFEVTRGRALRAVWGVYEWLQDNSQEFERMGTRAESEREFVQRKNLGITLESYEEWAASVTE